MKLSPELLRRENALAERAAGYWLLGAAVVVMIPHVARLPVWLSAVLVILFTWRFFIIQRAWAAPNRWLRWLLTAVLVFLLFRQYGTLFGRDAGSALLAAMLALKFMELQRLRDYVLSVLLIYFLIVVGLLYSQAMWLVIYLLAVFVLTTATLIRLAIPGARARFALRLAGVLLLQALPLMLAMHLLFPRLQGALWGMPQDAYAGLTGLSDEMAPGSIRELTLSDDVAFRAHFHGALPPPAQRYWRALVLWTTDGMKWTRGTDPHARPSYEAQDIALSYSLTLEPSNKPWIPALDLPVQAPSGYRLGSGFVLEANVPVRERLSLELSAHTRYRMHTLDMAERHAALQLPVQISPRVQALAEHWRTTKHKDAEVVQAALVYFRTEKYFYTLTPPELGDDPVDEFLFVTRRGFCEHYASSFVTLMRSAGIPARVVTGYQGGEYNPTGEYLIVRQLDAHAWAEVWLPDQGWVRVDPTAAIAPERIDYGADGLRRLLARGLSFGGVPPDALRAMLALDAFESARQQLRLSWDAANTAWQRLVLDYNQARQREFLALLGFEDVDPARLVGLLALLIALIMGLYVIATRQRVPRADPVQRAYLDFCYKLARNGLQRAPQEGALAYSERGAQLFPQHAAAIQAITALYLPLRYGDIPDNDKRGEFIHQVASFHPPRA
jgi:transglutaminase-like putative cysteine protease